MGQRERAVGLEVTASIASGEAGMLRPTDGRIGGLTRYVGERRRQPLV